ncbi:epoxyqueuosine reductase [Salibacterium salarium]|uniref:Epoxyqueuosine reductase n=1 Tax=Salibacterium salarium TaxID=284579 RepID=A0A3R9P7B8_9BACI|nr:tRNA epoxyqueuosine(34) reductase QueG [Salibacterium salarium]MDQ0299919.1 epoxyqueuosine reductase [Salibacterium salarium]RSL34330.1 tRNA epoxyqueuosine(34) reductase QueG [Salibacterium salarium]
MTGAELKEKIIAYSKEIGIDKIGFASTDPFLTLKDRLIEQQRLNYQSGFEEPDIDKRVTPTRLLPEAKTIIAIALAYPSKLENAPKSVKGDRRGLFCRASWGEDYHRVLRDRLDKLEAYIAEIAPEARCQSMVDTGELSDRAVAERAGIGWSGKNCAIITPEFGSYVYLGEMITTLSLEPDNEITDQCGTCNKCVDACPTGALVQGGQLDSNKCIAFLTQTKDFLPERYRKKIGNRLYGCDTCQTVCPENKGMDHHNHEEFEPDPEVVKPQLLPLLTLSNREFKEKFGPIAGSWRGKKPIQRNAVLALGTYKAKEGVKTLIHLLKNDPRPVIRGSSAWSLGQIGTEEAVHALEEANTHETSEKVLEEISKVLDPISVK